jgi:hypothetical protein
MDCFAYARNDGALLRSAMIVGVMLGGLMARIHRAGGVTVSGVSVMGGLFVVAAFVVLCRLMMMLGGVLVMLGGRLMVMGAFVRRFRHGLCSLWFFGLTSCGTAALRDASDRARKWRPLATAR